jgi:hypothetical protein
MFGQVLVAFLWQFQASVPLCYTDQQDFYKQIDPLPPRL